VGRQIFCLFLIRKKNMSKQYTISDLISSLPGKFHDASTNKFAGSIYEKIDEALRNILLEVDLKELQKKYDLVNAVYDDIDTYLAPDDINGDRIISIRPTYSDTVDRFSKTSEEDIALNNTDYTFSVDYLNGLKYLNINLDSDSQKKLLINSFDSLLGITNDNSDIEGGFSLDNFETIASDYSLKFNINSTQVSKPTTRTVNYQIDGVFDFSPYFNGGSFFVWIKLPKSINSNDTPVQSIKLKVFGANDLQYYTLTANTPHNFSKFIPGYQLVRFDLYNNPFPEQTYFFTFIFNVDNTKIDSTSYINIDEFVVRSGVKYSIKYYSNCYLIDADTGELKDYPTKDSDVIMLGKDSINVILYELCKLLAQELQGEDSKIDLPFFEKESNDAIKKYKLKYPTENKAKRSNYYRFRK